MGAMPDLNVRLALESLRCWIRGEGGEADEPYVMTVFFKVDGDTVIFDAGTLKMRGQATVVGTDSGQRDLGRKSVYASDIVPRLN
jgi:hypothetical protein